MSITGKEDDQAHRPWLWVIKIINLHLGDLVSLSHLSMVHTGHELASCLIYARALLEYVNLIVWVRSVNKMLPSVKFTEYKVLTFLILREKC